MSGQNPQNTPPAAPVPPAPVAPVAPAPTQTNLVSCVINGVEQMVDPAVKAHIEGLMTFKNETIETGRKNFVKDLAKQGKILASAEGIQNTEDFVMSLSGEQFAKYQASMEAAPAATLFGQHGTTTPTGTAPQNGGNATSDLEHKILVAQEIVQGHRDSGMPEATLKEKDSYKELENLLAQRNAQKS